MTKYWLAVVVDNRAAGLDEDGGRWSVLCKAHQTLVSVETRAVALADAKRANQAHFCEWCEQCADWRTGYLAAGDVLAAVAPELRQEFVEEELSETGRARGREITEESEQFHLGWEAALVEAKS